jgi:hypothetical protein
MIRRLTWTSLALLVVTIAYWIVAARIGKDFSRLGAEDHYTTASCVIGKTELAWLVDQRAVLVTVVSDSTGQMLPLIGRYGLVRTLMEELKWSDEPSNRNVYLLFSVTTFRGAGSDGGPVVVRVAWMPLYRVVGFFALLPMIQVLIVAWRRTARLKRSMRIGRVRRKRNGLGRCACGYDLRQSRRRCPECGRTIRWVPMAVPTSR